jgi:hypothetical protein
MICCFLHPGQKCRGLQNNLSQKQFILVIKPYFIEKAKANLSLPGAAYDASFHNVCANDHGRLERQDQQTKS